MPQKQIGKLYPRVMRIGKKITPTLCTRPKLWQILAAEQVQQM
jgi:hypothetical protein